MALILRYAVRSDLGLVRGNNEDSVYAGPRLLAIADGMGGHAAGEVASKIVIGDDGAARRRPRARRPDRRAARQRCSRPTTASPTRSSRTRTSTAWARRSPRCASPARRSRSCTSATRARTCCAATCSRRSRTTTPTCSTSSTRASSPPDEAKDHPRKSVILRALRGAEVEPDVSIREARAGDRYLLCSDGLSDVVSTETIFETLRIPDAQECADRLVELALRSGGPDNVTVIVADVVNARPGDVIDDVPVMDGAFVDPSAAAVPGADSAAERAARDVAPARPAAAASRRREAARRWQTPADHRRHPRADRGRARRHLRVGADAVLRRQGRQRGRDLQGRQRVVRAAEVLRGVREHRPQARRPESVVAARRSSPASRRRARPTRGSIVSRLHGELQAAVLRRHHDRRPRRVADVPRRRPTSTPCTPRRRRLDAQADRAVDRVDAPATAGAATARSRPRKSRRRRTAHAAPTSTPPSTEPVADRADSSLQRRPARRRRTAGACR